MLSSYLVAPDAGFFGDKVVESVLYFWVSWDQQQQFPHTNGDPVGSKNTDSMNKLSEFLLSILCTSSNTNIWLSEFLI